MYEAWTPIAIRKHHGKGKLKGDPEIRDGWPIPESMKPLNERRKQLANELNRRLYNRA